MGRKRRALMGIGAADSTMTALDGDPGRWVVPFGSNSVQNGTAVFEGIRCHRSVDGVALFRLDDHLRRLLASAAALGIPHDYDLDALRTRVVAAAERSGLDDAYLRPVLYSPEPRLGVGLGDFRFTLGVEVWPAAAEDEVAPVRLTISSWRRPGRSSFPVGVKATGIYVLSALAKTAAVTAGFDDAIQLDPGSGRVAEATIANVFAVRDGHVTTPWRDESMLPGITRDTVLALVRELGVTAVEGPVEPADLFAADELFLTGTAIGLVPVTSVDGHTYPHHRPVFTELRDAYQAAVRGRSPTPLDWLTPISTRAVSGGQS